MSKVGNIHLAITFDKFPDFTIRKLKQIKLFSSPMATQMNVYMILIKYIPLHLNSAFFPSFY